MPVDLEYQDYLDEYEMICIRGGSPTKQIPDFYNLDDDGSVYSDLYNDSDYYRKSSSERRIIRREKDLRKLRNKNVDEKNIENSTFETKNCFRHYSGSCTDVACSYSHEFREPKKLEICKFFLKGTCAKKASCTYMHFEFPCKFYYLGVDRHHIRQKCKFSHGNALSTDLNVALLKHIETAPQSILGDFPHKYRLNAANMLQRHNEKLMVTNFKTDFSKKQHKF